MMINYENYYIASAFNRKSTSRGGSFILVRKNIKAKERKDIVGLSVECCIEVSCVELEKHVIVCVYRPPNYQNFQNFELVMEDVLKLTLKSSNKFHIVCGDFNVNLLENTTCSNRLIGLFKSFNLVNIFSEPTRITASTATCIDNIFCDCGFSNKEIINCLQSDHSGQSVSFPYSPKNDKIIINKRLITSNQIEKYKTALNDKLPIPYYDLGNPNSFYSELFSILHSEFEDKFKVKKIIINPKFKFSDWATIGIRISRSRLFELYEEKSFNHSENFIEYVRTYSKIFKNVCVLAKAIYIKNKISSADNIIKTVWKVINCETGRTKFCDNSHSLNTAQGIVNTESEVAQEFETFFTNIPLKTTESLSSSPTAASTLLKTNVQPCHTVFEFRYINPHVVIKTFKDIKIKNTEDLWGMSVRLCSSIIETLAPYLASLFNSCIDQGVFPDLMKHSKVIPLFKSGDKKDPSNFRPVSVLPVLSKVFEKIVLNQMLLHFNINGLLHNQQFGFTKGRSTTDAAVALLQHIFGAWEESQDVVGVFCDLSKAFDCVNHETLLLKLEHYGVKERALDLISSYLGDRIQKVQINGAKSLGSKVKIGVPQGSILGPFLFLVYINDLPFMVENLTKIVLFADDTSLIFKVSRKAQDIDEVNSALSQIHNWFTKNNLVLNPKKTKCIKFSLPNVRSNKFDIVLNREKLDYVDDTVFLGITLDANLQWGPHITVLAGRLSSAAFAVRKIRQLTDVATARLVYFSYFHSVMSYGILLWGQAANIHTIFVLQKRAIRSIYKLRGRDSLRELFKEISILTLPSQYIFDNIMYARKNASLYLRNSDLHGFNTRNKNKIVQPQSRLSKIRNSFIGNCIQFYNKIPEDIVNLPDRQFKNKIKNTLYTKGYYKVDDYVNDKDVWSAVAPT